MWEIETDCYIGDDGLAYTNNRRYIIRTSEYPIEGLYVHPKTGLVREQPYELIRRRYRTRRKPSETALLTRLTSV